MDKEIRKLWNLCLTRIPILFLLFFLFLSSFFIFKPSVGGFKTFLENEDMSIPVVLTRNEDTPLATIHHVMNNDEFRIYVGIWNNYVCLTKHSFKDEKSNFSLLNLNNSKK